jgi:hypothetical protein
MSTLREALAAEKAAFRKGPGCSVGQLLASLDPPARADLQTALDEPPEEFPHSFIVRAVAIATGKRIGGQTISRHRAGVCQCDRS